MKIGIRSPFTGLIASAPMATPVFSRSVDSRSISVSSPAALGVRRDLPALRRRRQRVDQRMLRREDHERRAEERVRPRREDADLLATGVVVGRRRLEDDLAALRAPDPVRLHDPDRVGELDLGEVQQLVGVLRDAQVPLVQVALLDLRAAAPAAPVGALDLLARQRAVVRAEVDRRVLPVGQPGLQELQEEPLVPPVVVGVAGDDLARPSRTSRPSAAAGGACSRCSASSSRAG